MRRYILTGVMSGILMLGGSIVLGEEPRPSGGQFAHLQTPVGPEHPIRSFEERLALKPLSDEELGEITAAGVGPVVHMLPPWVFSPTLIQSPVSSRNSLRATGGFVVQSNHIVSFSLR